jgi:hypothetical protein
MPTWLGIALAGCFALVAGHRTVRRDAPGALMAGGMAVMSLGMAGDGPMFVRGPWWALFFVVVAVWPPLLRPLATWLAARVPDAAMARIPVLGAGRPGPVCGGPLAHLLGGVAMVYMCALPMSGMPGMSGGHAAHAGETATLAASAHAVNLRPGHSGTAVVSDPGALPGATGAAGAGGVPATGTPGMGGMAGMGGRMGTAGPAGRAHAEVEPLGSALSLVGWALVCYFLLGTITALTRRDPAGARVASRSTVLGEALMGFGTVVMLVTMT